MLKKFVSSLLAVTLLCACGAKEEPVASVEDLEKMTTEISSDLKLTDKLEKVEGDIVNGLFSFTEGAVLSSSVYVANDKTADTIAVFQAADIDSCKKSIKDYLQQQKVQMQNYYPDEVFKIDNAILEDDGSKVVLIICDDMEAAGTKVKSLLGK